MRLANPCLYIVQKKKLNILYDYSFRSKTSDTEYQPLKMERIKRDQDLTHVGGNIYTFRNQKKEEDLSPYIPH